jgi:hypothetical protein
MKRANPTRRKARGKSAAAKDSTVPTRIELIRPDDLLNLQVQFDNLRIDLDDEEGQPTLVIQDERKPAFVTFIFPPQTIAERAYFEAQIVPPGGTGIQPEPKNPRKNPEDGKTTSDATKAIEPPLDPPGYVDGTRPTVAQTSHSSRLVFKVSPDTRIPFTTEGLLDWSQLEPNVNPIAAIGPEPTEDQIAHAPAIIEPSPNETAIELPYRLVISPTAGVTWSHRHAPFTALGRTELWHTRLLNRNANGGIELSAAAPASLRAIWSPDYNAKHRGDATRLDPDLQRTAMAPDDRYQIVILTSAFHGYEVDIEIEIPFPFFVPLGDVAAPANRNVISTSNPVQLVAQRTVKLKRTVPYVPEPFYAEELMLSPLGGWLRSLGNWNPPRLAPPSKWKQRVDFKDVFAVLPQLHRRARNLPRTAALRIAAANISEVFLPGVFIPPDNPQLDLSEWVHIAAQGRDHYVRIVYEGELWPFRHRAALIKVTERKFKEQGSIVGAYQMQHMFIVVREPEKTFSDDERGTPFKRVQLTTLVTPDIANPDTPNDPSDPSGLNHVEGANRSFWVKVMTSETTRELFRFHAVGTDKANEQADFTIPLMFVSISDLPDTNAAATKAVAREYNAKMNIDRRSAHVPGQKITFAARDSVKPNDNTQLATRSLNFVVDAAGNPARMLKAEVNVPQIEQLLGSDAPTTIRYFQNYVDHNFDSGSGVFAEIAKQDSNAYTANNPFAGMVADRLGATFSSDKAGGFATPNLAVSTLTRALGPLAGKAAEAVNDVFDPASFFQKGIAQLFGSFDLTDLLPAASMTQNAPKLRTTTQNIPNGKLLVATLDWEPEIKNLDLGVAAFEKDRGGKKSALTIHGSIEKSIALNGSAPAVGDTKFDFTGKLNDFRVSVLKSVFINFDEFSFEAKSGQKTDVRVQLDPAVPIEFAGDLKFVEQLRKAIPPGLFGDGPSLDISPTGIRAGFAFALPPVSVGVFSLKDVSLGAALTLPFLDGKPVFDFNVSERAHPFLLAVAIFGGGGFFHLQLDTAGIKELEAAFEFGATAALDIGVASGEVHVMAGIYFSMQRKDPGTDLACVLSGYLRMGGSLSVLGLVQVSVEFNLSFTYDGVKDKAYGRATLTVHVSVLCFSASVDLTVERAFGGKSGDPTFVQLMNTPEAWADYALAFA